MSDILDNIITSEEILINEKYYTIYDMDCIDRDIYIGFIYVTINKVNGKKYLGQHTKWSKKYIGTGGRHFKKAKKEYGEENFKRYIIDVAKTQQELDEKETYYINDEFKAFCSDDWYNVKESAKGNPYAGLTLEERRIISELISKATSGENNPMYGKGYKLEGEKNGMHNVRKFGEDNPFFGKKHSDETRAKISASQKQQSQYYHYKQPCKLTFPNREEKIFDSSKSLIEYFKETYDLSKPIVINLLKSGKPYNPKNKGFEARGIKLERILNE